MTPGIRQPAIPLMNDGGENGRKAVITDFDPFGVSSKRIESLSSFPTAAKF